MTLFEFAVNMSPGRTSASSRSFVNQISVVVNGAIFHLLQRMEGRWNGEMTAIPPQDEGTQVCSSELLFREEEAVWSQRQMRTTIVGITTAYVGIIVVVKRPE